MQPVIIPPKAKIKDGHIVKPNHFKPNREVKKSFIELNNKYINKGIMQENDSIALFNSVMFSNYSKNTERLNNEWLTGEADIVLDDWGTLR